MCLVTRSRKQLAFQEFTGDLQNDDFVQSQSVSGTTASGEIFNSERFECIKLIVFLLDSDQKFPKTKIWVDGLVSLPPALWSPESIPGQSLSATAPADNYIQDGWHHHIVIIAVWCLLPGLRLCPVESYPHFQHIDASNITKAIPSMSLNLAWPPPSL